MATSGCHGSTARGAQSNELPIPSPDPITPPGPVAARLGLPRRLASRLALDRSRRLALRRPLRLTLCRTLAFRRLRGLPGDVALRLALRRTLRLTDRLALLRDLASRRGLALAGVVP